MFSLLALPVLAASALAIITPTTPDSSGVYPAGSNCPIAWTQDPTGVWSSFTIELMTGPNNPMVELEVVASGLDGTTATGISSFSYPCPQVDINAPIYFYQFSQPGVTNLTWTTRFTIASASGATVAAPDPADDVTPAAWGTGQLIGASASGASASGAGSSTTAGGHTRGTSTTAADDGTGATQATDDGAAGPTTTPNPGGVNSVDAGGNTQFTTAAGDGTVPGAAGASAAPSGSGTFVPYSPSQSPAAGNAKSAAAPCVPVLGWSDLLIIGAAVWVGVGMM